MRLHSYVVARDYGFAPNPFLGVCTLATCKPKSAPPWELGFFDGYAGRVGVIPITRAQEESFKGEEYLSLYPYVDRAPVKGGEDKLWINRASSDYAPLYEWIKGAEEIRAH